MIPGNVISCRSMQKRIKRSLNFRSIFVTLVGLGSGVLLSGIHLFVIVPLFHRLLTNYFEEPKNLRNRLENVGAAYRNVSFIIVNHSTVPLFFLAGVLYPGSVHSQDFLPEEVERYSFRGKSWLFHSKKVVMHQKIFLWVNNSLFYSNHFAAPAQKETMCLTRIS